MKTLALFGAGRIGRIHAANIKAHPAARLKYVVDVDAQAADVESVREAARVLQGEEREHVELIRAWMSKVEKPADDWFAANFNAENWRSGPAGFGTRQTPNTVVRTPWNTSDIWIRRDFELPSNGSVVNPHLLIHHDEDTEVYINGVLAAEVRGYNGGFEQVRISAAAAKSLKSGKNTIAAHVRQTTGGQYIDVGIVDVVPAVRAE